jgi:tetratricopeptide (TPR) repeat protein
MDTRQVVARFEAERQALAMMDHPHIAKVFDGGATPSGRPYFVMELVKGVPITEFCDLDQLPPRDRLQLFIAVCQAVQHAHQKGIIHRDLKPTNVLVTVHDTTPVVKVIDFGVAKALGQNLTEKTLFTGFAQMVGTPLYMSPEQAGESGLDIDTRSDIYSLGVLLYELLTGTTPFDREQFEKSSYEEILRIIREQEPLRPSQRVSTLGKQGTSLSALRRSDPKALVQLCRGELDWIVMKALEKDRARRFESAGALAADVDRYLRDEPVQACPPSRWYRIRKLARRNKPAFLTGTALAAGVLLAVAALLVSNVRISREQVRTRDEKARADRAQKLAEERASEIQRDLERLKKADDLVDRARWYADQYRMDDALHALTRAAELRPDHATVWFELSNLHTRIGLWDAAAADFARELERREPDYTIRWYRHALLRLTLDDVEGYLQLRRRMHARFRRTLTDAFILELMRTSALGRESDPELETMARLADQFAPGSRDNWFGQYVAALIAYRAGRYEQAAERLRQSIAVARGWPSGALNYPVLAMAEHRLGRPAEARQALADADAAIERWTKAIYEGREHPHWWIHLGAEVTWPVLWWDWLECRLFAREAKLLIDGVAPPADPRLHVLRARAFAGLRQQSRAVAEYTLALKDLADEPRVRFEMHCARGYLHTGSKRWSEAALEFARAAELQPGEVDLWFYQAVTHAAAGEPAAYRRSCEELLARFGQSEDLRTVSFLLRACVLTPDGPAAERSTSPGMGRARLAELGRRATFQGQFGASMHASALYRFGKYEEALRAFEALGELYRPRTWEWAFLAMIHHRLGHAQEAERCRAEAARWIEAARNADPDDQADNAPAFGEWAQQAEFPLLLREAEALLKNGSPR